MKLVQRTGPGKLEINYMWMPTWIGFNAALIREIEEYLARYLMGQPITEETLEKGHNLVLRMLAEKFPHLNGLFDYLDGIKFVEENGSAQTSQD